MTTKKTTAIDEDMFAVDMDEQRLVNRGPSTDKKQKRKDDPRYWKPRLQRNDEKDYIGSYQAIVRPFPQLGWLQDTSLPFSVEQYMHYVKDKVHGIWL